MLDQNPSFWVRLEFGFEVWRLNFQVSAGPMSFAMMLL